MHGTTHVVRKAGAFRHSHIKHRQWVLHWTLKLAMLGGIEQLVYQQWPKGRLPIRNFAARSRDAISTDDQVGREVFHVLQLFENGGFRSHRASLATAKRQYVNGCALRCDLLLLTFRCRGVRRRRHGWLCLRRGQACKCRRLNSALSQSIFCTCWCIWVDRYKTKRQQMYMCRRDDCESKFAGRVLLVSLMSPCCCRRWLVACCCCNCCCQLRICK